MKLRTAIGSIALSFGLHFRGGSAVPCCSWNYKNCSPEPSWCDESKENCLGEDCGGKVYLEGPFTPQTENCKGLGEACYDDSDCCLGYMYFADTQRIPWLQQKLQYCREGVVGDDGVEYRGCTDVPYEYCCSWQRHVDRCQRQSPWCHLSEENCEECLGEPGGYIPNTDAYKNCSRRQRGCKTDDECCGDMTCQWIDDPAIFLSSYDFPYFGCEDPINGGTGSDNEPCCSWNYKNCSPEPSWCDESKENCLGDDCGGKVYLEGPFTEQTKDCSGLGETCDNFDTDCCFGGWQFIGDARQIPWLRQKLQYCVDNLEGDDGVVYRGCTDIPYEYCCSWQRHADECARQSAWCHLSAENCEQCLEEPGGYIPYTDEYMNCSGRQMGCQTHEECCGHMTCQWIDDPAILRGDSAYFGCEDP